MWPKAGMRSFTCLFSLFIMDLAWMLEENGLGVRIWGKSMGKYLYVDDSVLLAGLLRVLQEMWLQIWLQNLLTDCI